MSNDTRITAVSQGNQLYQFSWVYQGIAHPVASAANARYFLLEKAKRNNRSFNGGFVAKRNNSGDWLEVVPETERTQAAAKALNTEDLITPAAGTRSSSPKSGPKAAISGLGADCRLIAQQMEGDTLNDVQLQVLSGRLKTLLETYPALLESIV